VANVYLTRGNCSLNAFKTAYKKQLTSSYHW